MKKKKKKMIYVKSVKKMINVRMKARKMIRVTIITTKLTSNNYLYRNN